MTSAPSPPEPPEEPLASDCCGSGCATCVYDIYDQQRAQYEQALTAWKEKHGADHPLLKVKRSSASSKSAETVERVDVNALRERLFSTEQQPDDAVSADDDDDDDGDGFNDAELSVSASYAGVASEGGVGAFDNSVVTNLTQLPASVARGVRVGDDSDAFLAFRRDDDGQWARISSLTADRDGDAASYCTTTLRLAPSSPQQQRLSLLSAFRPGDTVEALCMPSRFAVEEFLRTFAASSSITTGDSDSDRTAELLSTHGRTGSLLEEALTARGAAQKPHGSVPFPISDGVFLDVDRFPFVSSPLPPWLERCCSLLRTQRPELRTRGGLQTLSLGQLLRTVVDVSSWAALQRPLLRRMLDVAESKLHAEKVVLSTTASSSPPLVPMQVAALRALVKLPTTAVHDWVRCAWVVSSSSGNDGDQQHTVGTVGDLLKRFPSVAQQLQVAFPEQLLDLPIRRRQWRADEPVGSVSFLLSSCFRESVDTQLFAPSAPLRDFTTGAAKKVLTLPRLLEVAPPLRGRIFSVAGGGGDSDSNSIDLLSNCERRSNVWYSCLDADAARAAAPPWAGIVSSTLDGDAAAVAGESAMFLRSGAELLAASNAKKRKMLAQAAERESSSGSEPPASESFADSLATLSEKLRRGDAGGQQLDVLFLCAGTGFAPFRFFLQRELALAAAARAQRNVNLTMLFGLRHAPCARTVSFLSSLLSAGVLSQVHVAVSRGDAQSRAALGGGGALVVYPSMRVPDLISAKSIFAPLSAPRGLLHVFSCGPPAFVASCRSAVTSARTQTDQAAIAWHNDDWSS
jgi:hypothetical protein